MLTENDVRNILLDQTINTEFVNFINNLESPTRKAYLEPINNYIKTYLKEIINDKIVPENIPLIETYSQTIFDFNIDNYNIFNDVELIKLYKELDSIKLDEDSYNNSKITDNFNINKIENILLKMDMPTDIIGFDRYVYLTDVLQSKKIPKISMREYSGFMETLIENNLVDQSKSFELRKNRVSVELPNIMGYEELSKPNKNYDELNQYFIKKYVKYLIKENKDPNEDDLIVELRRNLKNPQGKFYRKELEGLTFEKLDTDFSKYNINDDLKDYNNLLKTVGNCYKEGKKIPAEICEFLINGYINNKYKSNDKYAFKGMIIGIYEEILDQLNMNSYVIGFNTQPTKKSLKGSHNLSNKTIKINIDKLDDFIEKKDPLIFETLFHELMHAYQWKKINDKNIGFSEYQMIKDLILSSSQKFQTYRDDNYKFLTHEMDARRYAPVFSINLLGEIDKQYMEEYKKDALLREEKETKKIKDTKLINKRKIDKQTIRLDDLFDQYISLSKDIISKERFNHLRVEYKDDGQKKSVGEIIEDYQNGLFEQYGIKENELGFINELLIRRFPKESDLVYSDITSILNLNIEDDKLKEIINTYMKKNISISFNTTQNKEELATNLNSFLKEYVPNTKEKEQYLGLINNKFLNKYNLQVQNCKLN